MATLILVLIVVDVLQGVVIPELTHTVALVRTAEINDNYFWPRRTIFPCFKNDLSPVHATIPQQLLFLSVSALLSRHFVTCSSFERKIVT